MICVSLSQVKVMHKQLLLFHNAISAYFAGNQQQLEQTLKQFNIKLKPPGADKPSWLEEQWKCPFTSGFLLYVFSHTEQHSRTTRNQRSEMLAETGAPTKPPSH